MLFFRVEHLKKDLIPLVGIRSFFKPQNRVNQCFILQNLINVIKLCLILTSYNFSPNAKSPASPNPGIIYECSFNSGSMAAAQTVVLTSGKCAEI